MKILLLTHGRTGSSSFQQAISDVLNLENIDKSKDEASLSDTFDSNPYSNINTSK